MTDTTDTTDTTDITDTIADTPERPAPEPVMLTPKQAKLVRRTLWVAFNQVTRKLSAYVPEDDDQLVLALRRQLDALEATGGLRARP